MGMGVGVVTTSAGGGEMIGIALGDGAGGLSKRRRAYRSGTFLNDGTGLGAGMFINMRKKRTKCKVADATSDCLIAASGSIRLDGGNSLVAGTKRKQIFNPLPRLM